MVIWMHAPGMAIRPTRLRMFARCGKPDKKTTPDETPTTKISDTAELSVDVEIEKTYTGVCNMPMKMPGDVIPAQNKTISNQEECESFISSIPSKDISNANPAPDSDGPLLKKPAIDFGKNMALALTKANTLSTKPTIDSIAIKGKVIAVKGSYPKPPQIESYPEGIGSYTFVIIPKFTGEVKFDITAQE